MFNHYNCVRLLSAAVQAGLIQRDPSDGNRILIYRAAGTKEPEGWYSENLFSVAQELLKSEAGQQFIASEVEKATGRPFKPKLLI